MGTESVLSPESGSPSVIYLQSFIEQNLTFSTTSEIQVVLGGIFSC